MQLQTIATLLLLWGTTWDNLCPNSFIENIDYIKIGLLSPQVF